MIRKMDRENRAKQFMPFAALKGHSEVLEKEEWVRVEQAELSDEYKEEIDRKLHQMQPGDYIWVEYYRNGAYHQLTGYVSKIQITQRCLLVDACRIPFDSLRDLHFAV